MKQDPSSGARVNVNAALLLTSAASSLGFQWGVSDSRLNLLSTEAFPLGSIGSRFAVAPNTLTGSDPHPLWYRGTSLIRNCPPVGPCSSPMPEEL